MQSVTQYLLLALALASVQISFTESRLNEKRRDKTVRRFHPRDHIEENICDTGKRESKVHCYCDNSEIQSASRADCWVFTEGLTEDDAIWSLFSKQANIERLSFSVRFQGSLAFVPLHLIHKLKHLQKLSITYATLQKLGKRTFSNLTTIKEIKLTESEITELDFSSFANLPSLVNLTIKENRITEIQRDVFVDLPSLKYLDLTFNNISLAHDACFEHLPQLNDLLLESNSITILTRETFRGLSNLTRLDLRSNKLTMLGDLTFTELWNLNELLLDNNELRFISERAFDGLSMLQKLSMTGNRLKSIHEGLLEGVRGLELLDLRNNELESFTSETIKPILDNLKMKTSVLYLSGNNLSCDCRLSWVYSLKNGTKSEPLRYALEEITCIPVETQTQPNIVKSKEIKDLDEAGNILDEEKSGDDDKYLEPTVQPLVAKQLALIDIPVDSLPCQKDVSISEDLNVLSSKVQSFWGYNKCSEHSSNTAYLLLVAFIFYVF